MRATVTPILDFLEGSKQFVIPIYQRTYSWKKEQCQRLWDDVLRMGVNPESSSHFFGSIVYMEPEEPQNIGAVRQLLIIDGQQRLASLSLLLSGLCKIVKEQDIDIGITPNQLSSFYLFNGNRADESRYKQLLTRGDKETLIHLLEDRELPEGFSTLLKENHRFFLSQLKGVDLKIVYKGIQRLKIVDIMLTRGQDNPQLIFESLNSAGLPLSQSDLIRNYVLMGQDLNFQTRLYEEYWFPMEQRFRDQNARRFDSFMRDYLTLRTGRIPKRNGVYKHFKTYVSEAEGPKTIIEIIVKDISDQSKHYVNIALLQEEDSELRGCLEDLHELRAEVTYPFLLEVYDYYQQGRIEKTEVIKILRLVESYVFRRAICSQSAKQLNHTFVHLINNVDKSNYFENLNETFLDLNVYRHYPRNSEFKKALISKDVYNFNRRNYLLRKLENYERKEPIEIGNYTIEHVMPQNLTEVWQQELGENFRQIHEIWLHKIGNLTLTGYNSELSNRPFKEKREMHQEGFRYSPLHLNKSLADAEQWNEEAIIARSNELAERACKIWIYPQ